jgi:hypothetical protein
MKLQREKTANNVKVKVKFSHYRPKQALGDPEG